MKTLLKRSFIAVLSLEFAILLAGALAVSAQAPVPDSPAIEAKAHAMIAKLTLEQKIELLGGVDKMFTVPMPAIDLPRFKMSDASLGVRTWGPTELRWPLPGTPILPASWARAWAATLAHGASTFCSAPA
ncbi:MAG: hypothetical protein WDM87_18500 [Terracidiphilus sp.]